MDVFTDLSPGGSLVSFGFNWLKCDFNQVSIARHIISVLDNVRNGCPGDSDLG